MNRSLALTCLLAASGLLAPQARAQYALRAAVVANGATEAAGGSYALRATTGEPAVGPVAGGSYTAGQGFWYPATAGGGTGGPLVDLTLTPINPPPPVVIARGGTLRYRADFAIAASGPSSFQYWAEATLPNNQVRFLFGPVTVNGTPGTTVTRNLQQRVPQNVPLGNYVFRMKVGTYPGTIYDEDSFPVTVVSAEALATRAGAPARRVAPATHEGAGTARQPAVRAGSAPGRAAAASAASVIMPEAVARRLADDPFAWLAWDADGTILEAGVVQDLRFAAHDLAENGPGAEKVGAHAEGEGAPTVPLAGGTTLPTAATLSQAFPNPFGNRATIRFGIPESRGVRLAVYDALGRAIAVLVDGQVEAGWHEAVLEGGALPAGVYVVRMTAGGFVESRVLTRLR